MGWLEGLKNATQLGLSSESLALAAPQGDASVLQSIVLPALPDGPISIAKALAVPPVARGVLLYLGAIASFPLTVKDGPAPSWLTDTKPGTDPAGRRQALTLLDLLMVGRCLWYAEDKAGNHVERVDPTLYTIDDEGYVLDKDKNRADPSKVILIQSLLPMGFLDYGKSSVNQYHNIVRTIQDRSDNPQPITELRITDQTLRATDEEVRAAQEQYAGARRAKNGAITVTPFGMELHIHDAGSDANQMMTEARNAARLDFANFLGINAAMLDGNSGTSDTYSNTLQNQNEFLTLSLSLWLLAIEQRLSQPDVIGAPVKFDTSAFDTADKAGNTGTAKGIPAPVQEDQP